MITVLSVNYNTPEFIIRLVKSFRQFYNYPFIIVDGSSEENYQSILCLLDYDVEIHHFDYNIHHGPGLAYGFQYIKTDKILVLDSDLIVIKKGFIEDLNKKLNKDSYGIGDIQTVNKNGINSKMGYEYLHPACMLINREIALKWPSPIKHGAPMIETMISLHKKNLLQHADWVTNDFRNPEKKFIIHDWQGTVNKTGGYHL